LVTVDGRVIWDKKGKDNGRFPEDAEVLSQLR
jgi:predicted Rdx family selenoprotein